MLKVIPVLFTISDGEQRRLFRTHLLLAKAALETKQHHLTLFNLRVPAVGVCDNGIGGGLGDAAKSSTLIRRCVRVSPSAILPPFISKVRFLEIDNTFLLFPR
jgi:hypothetical protein